MIIEVALHLPVTEIEAALGAAVQTGAIRAAAVRKRAAQFSMAAAKDTRHETSDFSRYLSSLFCYLPVLHRLTSFVTAFHVANAKTFTE